MACGECGTVIAAGSMSGHLMTRHGKAAKRRHLWAPQMNGGPRTYKMHFPAKGGRRRCPVERCPGVLATRAAMRVNFVHRHVHDTVVILEEGNLPLPRFPPVQPPGIQEGAQWAPPGDQPVQDGDGAETETTGGGGDEGHTVGTVVGGRLTSSSITAVSWTCRCTKCTRISVPQRWIDRKSYPPLW